MQRLAVLTASGGTIPPTTPPSSHSSYSQVFSGPYVRCEIANSTVASSINNLLHGKMQGLQGTYLEKVNAFYSFVPPLDENLNCTSIIDGAGTKMTTLSEPRLEQPHSAMNELWFTSMRYTRAQDGTILTHGDGIKGADRQFVQFKLHHVTYTIITLQFNHGTQIATKNEIDILESINFSDNDASVLTNLTKHVYSAYFSVFTDHVVESIGSLNDTMPNGKRSQVFNQINTAILRNSLLGSDDLGFYFDTNKRLYLYNTEPQLSPQRLLDIALAKNQTLPYLMEDLAFNITVALLLDPLLTYELSCSYAGAQASLSIFSPNQTVISEQNKPVSRYAFNAKVLWLVYGLTILFSLLAVAWGMLAFYLNQSSHGTSVSSIMNITRERELDSLFPACTHGG